jgi:molecular chaperone DnaK
VEIHVLQGERELARDNRTLGKFILEGLPTAPRGVPQIEVSFDIDANGILHVSAKDRATGKEQKIVITASTGMSEAEIQKMVKDAEMHVEDDKKRKEEIEVRNRLDNLVYGTGKTLGEGREKLPVDEVKAVEDALSSAKEALSSGDVDRMKAAEQDVTKVSHKMAEVLYKSAGQGPSASDGGAGQGQQGGAGPGNDDVIDAEFEDGRKSA